MIDLSDKIVTRVAKNTDDFSKLIDEVSNQANQAHGPDIYVIRSLIPLIKSNQKVVEASERIKRVMERFEATSEKREIQMKAITLIGIFVALAQFVLAYVIWKF